jgi:copper(I)-binding protein
VRRAATALVALVLAAPTVAASRPAVVAVRDPVIRPAVTGQPVTAAYMTLVNSGAEPLKLTAVACDCAGMVEPHESTMAGGVMRMRPAGPVIVPPHGSVSFRPGGLHLMIMDLKQAIRPGDRVPMRLSFDHGSSVIVSFAARK